MNNKKLINIGCGETTDLHWINIDIASSSADVVIYDVRRGLPFEDGEFDACYCSHMLEHVTKIQARVIVGDAYRVLKKGGIARFVVPDLEQIARLYLKNLELVTSGQIEFEADYDWMMLELFDQTVRNCSGGEMSSYLTSEALSNKTFIKSRIGLEADRIWSRKLIPRRIRIAAKLKTLKPSWFFRQLQINLTGFFVGILAGTNAKNAFYEGMFRESGEIHRWMYDRFSLHRLLAQAGFTNIKICKASESAIPNFSSYNLDVLNGHIRKPDSIFMEAIKS